MSEPHTTTGTEVPHHEVEPTAFGLTAPAWIALAMIVVIAIMIWKKVPGAIAGALDSKIALIRDQLAEAESLRKEAEALKAEYEAKSASADKDRDALASARAEIEGVASEATRHMVERLTGIEVDTNEAASAVKAELNV